MALLSAAEQFILKRLIEDGRLSAVQADELMQALDLHRIKDPQASIADLLIQRKLVTPSDMNKLIWEAENAASSRGAGATGAAAQPAGGGPVKARRGPAQAGGQATARRIVVARAPRASSMQNLIYAGIVIWVVVIAGIGIAFYFKKQRDNDEALERAQRGASSITDSTSAAADDEAAKILNPLIVEQKRRLSDVRVRERPASRIEGLREIALALPPCDLRAEVEKELGEERANADLAVEQDFEKLRAPIHLHTTMHELGSRAEALRTLIDRYGEGVLGGRLKYEYDRVCAEIAARKERAAAQATELASAPKDPHAGAREDGSAGGSGSSGAEEVAKPPPAKDPPAEPKKDDPKRVDPKPDAPKPGADGGATSKNDRVARISERLSDLFKGGSCTLDEDGVAEFSYYFSSRDPKDCVDWTPAVGEGAALNAKIRWTVFREEDDLNRKGLHLSDDGVYLHSAQLLPPIEVTVTFFPKSSFQAKNLVAAAWVNDKGKGVGSVYGRQTVVFGSFKPIGQRMPAALSQVAALRDYTFSLLIDGTGFKSGTDAGQATESRELPKEMTSGRCGVIWANSISGIMTSIKFSGKLDLDWAEKQLAGGK